MDLLVEMNGYKRWWKTKFCCDDCMATNPACRLSEEQKLLTYMNFSPEAPWRATTLTHEAYMASDEDKSPFSMIDGWRKESSWRDWAHTMHLGCERDLGAALIKPMHLRKELPGGDLPMQLRQLWSDFNEYRRSIGKRKIAGGLTPASLGLDNMPLMVYFHQCLLSALMNPTVYTQCSLLNVKT